MTLPSTVHASAVLVGETGILIRGASGSGKSALALGLIDNPAGGAWLIADDRVVLTAAHGRLIASPPEILAGRIEIRGQGIARRPFVAPAVIRLLVDLLPPGDCLRMPTEDEGLSEIGGIALPCLRAPLRLADGTTRVRAALVGLRRSVA